MANGGESRRRIDRVTAPDYLDALEDRTVPELRDLRDECRAEEDELSYVRRLLQARLDITRGELARRTEGGQTDLVQALPRILADRRPPGSRHARAVGLFSPGDNRGRRSYDALTSDASIGRLPDLGDDELRELADRLEEEERRVSGLRRAVLDHLDTLQGELARRYRAGDVGVDDLVARVTGDSPRDPR